MTKHNQYRITIEEINPESIPQTLSFEIEDRENIFDKIEKINQGSGLEPLQATRLAVALRLLGPVMMENRKHPLFADLMPHFKNFMQNLKSTVKKHIEQA